MPIFSANFLLDMPRRCLAITILDGLNILPACDHNIEIGKCGVIGIINEIDLINVSRVDDEDPLVESAELSSFDSSW